MTTRAERKHGSSGLALLPGASDAVAFFRARFRAKGKTERATFEKRYLKSDLAFHGVDMATIRTAALDFLREREGEAPLSRRAVVSIATELFASEFHDERSAAIAILERCVDRLALGDVPWLVSLVRRSPGWAHVDWVSAKVLGPVVQDTPPMRKLLRAWAKDDDFWVRRTALLAQLVALRTGGGDFALFEALAAPMLDEKEFFIRKAIGWVLRETAKKRPALVRGFIARHGDAMSGLTRREAEKGLRARTRTKTRARTTTTTTT